MNIYVGAIQLTIKKIEQITTYIIYFILLKILDNNYLHNYHESAAAILNLY